MENTKPKERVQMSDGIGQLLLSIENSPKAESLEALGLKVIIEEYKDLMTEELRNNLLQESFKELKVERDGKTYVCTYVASIKKERVEAVSRVLLGLEGIKEEIRGNLMPLGELRTHLGDWMIFSYVMVSIDFFYKWMSDRNFIGEE